MNEQLLLTRRRMTVTGYLGSYDAEASKNGFNGGVVAGFERTVRLKIVSVE